MTDQPPDLPLEADERRTIVPADPPPGIPIPDNPPPWKERDDGH